MKLFVVFAVAVAGLVGVSARDVPQQREEEVISGDQLDWTIPEEIEALMQSAGNSKQRSSFISLCNNVNIWNRLPNFDQRPKCAAQSAALVPRSGH